MMIGGVFLLLGTNLGNRARNLEESRKMIVEKADPITRQSPIYKTAAWGKENQPWFLNQVVEIGNSLSPEDLMKTLLYIEGLLGRTRYEKWGQRLIDIDILLFGNEIIHTKYIKIPHPGIPDRRFTLVPLCDLIPDVKHPVMGVTFRTLLEQCKDDLEVSRWEN